MARRSSFRFSLQTALAAVTLVALWLGLFKLSATGLPKEPSAVHLLAAFDLTVLPCVAYVCWVRRDMGMFWLFAITGAAAILFFLALTLGPFR